MLVAKVSASLSNSDWSSIANMINALYDTKLWNTWYNSPES